MAWISSLRGFELEYELKLRGATQTDLGTVAENRAYLRGMLAEEKRDSEAVVKANLYSREDDLKEISQTLMDVRDVLETADSSWTSARSLRVDHKLQHVTRRLKEVQAREEQTQEPDPINQLRRERFILLGLLEELTLSELCQLDETGSSQHASQNALASQVEQQEAKGCPVSSFEGLNLHTQSTVPLVSNVSESVKK